MSLSAFTLHDLTLAVEASSPALAERAAAVLVHFGARPSAPVRSADLAMVLTTDGEPPRVGERETARHLDVRVLRDEDGLAIQAPGAVSRLTADGHRSRTWLDREVQDQIPLHLLTYVLANQLRLLGRYTLHAGAVAWDGAGCLIVGESGAGKSTLTLSLLGQGWKLLSDDSVLLRSDGEVEALRRGIFLEPTTAAANFPALAGRWQPCALVEATKQQLRLDQVFPDAQVERCRPAVIVLPTVGEGPDTEFEAVSPGDVLYELIRQSRLSELDTDGAADHLARVGELASRVPGWRVRLGRDVLDRPERVAAELRGRLSS